MFINSWVNRKCSLIIHIFLIGAQSEETQRAETQSPCFGFFFFVVTWGKGKELILFFFGRQSGWDEELFIKPKDSGNYLVMHRSINYTYPLGYE